jgi:hypothetical protein
MYWNQFVFFSWKNCTMRGFKTNAHSILVAKFQEKKFFVRLTVRIEWISESKLSNCEVEEEDSGQSSKTGFWVRMLCLYHDDRKFSNMWTFTKYSRVISHIWVNGYLHLCYMLRKNEKWICYQFLYSWILKSLTELFAILLSICMLGSCN